jgi:hypothetical protein
MSEAEGNGSEGPRSVESGQNKSNEKSQRFARSGKMLTLRRIDI